MARWEIHQSDSNAAELYKSARRLGFSVQVLNRPIDAIFGIYDQTIAVEVKTEKGKLEPSQRTFFRTFKGLKAIIRSRGDIFELYAELRRRHDLIFAEAATHNGGTDGKATEGKDQTQGGKTQRRRRHTEAGKGHQAAHASAAAAVPHRRRAN